MSKAKIKEWLKRYLPAEIFSLVATLAFAGLVFRLTGSNVSAALAGTWGGNVAYFGLILVKDIADARKRYAAEAKTYNGKAVLLNLRALAVEFGLAEVLDSFLIRPALMYYLPLWLGSFTTGIVAAKFAADVTFYLPAIIGYELHKKHFSKTV